MIQDNPQGAENWARPSGAVKESLASRCHETSVVGPGNSDGPVDVFNAATGFAPSPHFERHLRAEAEGAIT